MRSRLTEYAQIGVVYHALYPKCVNDPDYHEKSLIDFVKNYNFETFDCILPFSEERRKRIVPFLKNSGKEIVYSNHIYLKENFSLASVNPTEQELIRIIFEDQINSARDIGSKEFIFASGPAEPGAEGKSLDFFKEFCYWFCKRLKEYGITALLEPFDYSVDCKFLYGPTDKCIELIKTLEPEIDNLAIELDFAHLPLMGEDFHKAVKNTINYLRRVHIGNCVLKNNKNPLYGDKHPPIGVDEGEIGIKEISDILRILLDFDYLNKNSRGALILEVKPLNGASPEETIRKTLDQLDKAWELI